MQKVQAVSTRALVTEVEIQLGIHAALRHFLKDFSSYMENLMNAPPRQFEVSVCDRDETGKCRYCGFAFNNDRMVQSSGNEETISCSTGPDDEIGVEGNQVVITITNHTLGLLLPCEITMKGKGAYNVERFYFVQFSSKSVGNSQ